MFVFRPKALRESIKRKYKDPLFYIGIILLTFWVIDAWYKITVQHAPTRMFWWSASGLGVTSVALISRNVFLTTSMFCALFITESLWTLSFFSNLIFKADRFLFAKYAFGKTFPLIGFAITLFHLFIIPSLIYALIKLKKVSRYGWLGAYIFGLIVAYLPLFFPNKEDVNCVRGDIESCRLYFQFLYLMSPALRIFVAATILLLLFFIPLNILLLKLSNKKIRKKLMSKFPRSPN